MGKILLNEGAAPDTPSSGKAAVYVKTDGKAYVKDDTGAETVMNTDAAGVAAAGAVMKTERKIATEANITAGNYTEFEADGTITFVGNATVWDDLRVSLLTAKLPSSSYPSFAKIADDGAGSTGIYGYSFDDGEYIFITTQIPHSWKEGTTIYPHIHFMTTSDVDPSENFGIGIEYTWTDIDDDMDTNSTLTVTIDVPTGVNSKNKHQFANIPANGIDGTGHTISSVLMVRLFRAAASTDNYADPVIITDFDIHFEKDTAGSRNITVK